MKMKAADLLKEISGDIKSGNTDAAMEKLNGFVAKNPE